MYYISYMKTKTQTSKTLLDQSVEKMLQSKVDMDTSDIFFNFGAVTYFKAVRDSNKSGYYTDYNFYLKQDAIYFLETIDRPNITSQDLVDDFLNRL